MDKTDFNLMSLQDQLIILKTEAEELTTVPSLANEVTLYSYNGYLIEEYRNRESNDLIKIETLTKENEGERLQIYSMYINFMNDAATFKKRGESKYMAVCINCDYEWFLDGNLKMKEVTCPMCSSGSWIPLLPKTCSDCNFVYYSNGGALKRLCPRCEKII